MLQKSSNTIVLLAYPGAQSAALEGLADVFAIANVQAAGAAPLRVVRLGADATETDLCAIGRPAAIVVPPTLATPDACALPEGCVAWLGRMQAQGSCLAAICVGTFLLARTGLLDGRAVAAHWSLTDALSRACPHVRIAPGRLLVDDGDCLTSAGIMSWPDVGLRLVERLLGPAAMLATARFLLIDPPRTEQRVYQRFTPFGAHGDSAVGRVQSWLETEAFRTAQVSDMARMAGLEERTFLRRFQKATGRTPVEYLQGLRVEHGRRRLEAGGLPVDRIAWDVGYQDASAFRKIFLRATGLSPAAYRKRFGASAKASVSAE